MTGCRGIVDGCPAITKNADVTNQCRSRNTKHMEWMVKDKWRIKFEAQSAHVAQAHHKPRHMLSSSILHYPTLWHNPIDHVKQHILSHCRTLHTTYSMYAHILVQMSRC